MNWRTAVRRATGDPTAQCYVMAEAYWHLEGKRLGWSPMQGRGCTMRTAQVSHWWLENDSGRILDLSSKQFNGERFPYERGRSTAFMTQKPSKRAAEIMRTARRLMRQASLCKKCGGQPGDVSCSHHPLKRVMVHVSVNGHKIRQNGKDGRRRLIFRREQGSRITYHNEVLIPAGAKLVYSPERPLKCGAKAWIEWEA